MSVPTINLRDKRKPGHCWQDNELYDCFQPVIGPLPVGVYVRITRECYGTTVKISLRELAAATGISKSAAQRAMAVLERIGLVIAKRGPVKRAPEYDLADLKELAIGYGATFDGQRCSYVLSLEASRRLRLEVEQMERRMQGKCVPVRDAEEDGGVPHGANGVPREGQSCPSNPEKMSGHLISKKSRNKNKYKTPSVPLEKPRGEGENESGDAGGRNAESANATHCAERVMRECGWVNRRLQRVVEDAIGQEVARGAVAGEVAERMIASWRRMTADSARGLLRYALSPRKFIAEAHWQGSARWPYDPQKLDMAARAATGMHLGP